MRSDLIPEKVRTIIVILSLLGGCGHKGPLKLPEPKPPAPQAQAANPQIPDAQTPEAPSLPPVEKP